MDNFMIFYQLFNLLVILKKINIYLLVIMLIEAYLPHNYFSLYIELK